MDPGLALGAPNATKAIDVRRSPVCLLVPPTPVNPFLPDNLIGAPIPASNLEIDP